MDKPGFPEVIDSTMRGSFVGCPQKFYEEFILCRARKGGSIHLVAGAAFAKGLEIVRTLVWGPDQVPIDDALAVALPYVIAEYGDFPVPAGYEHKSCERVIGALVAYFDHYQPALDHIQPYIKANKYPAVEFTFSFPLQIKHPTTGNPILYAGRFDMVGTYNDLLWVVDEKTATMLGPSWDKSFQLRGQLTGYTFAARQFGLPVEGAIVRGVSFLKSGAYGFSEPIEYRQPFQVERWYAQLHRDVARMIHCWQEDYWDFNLADACTSYGGCQYLNLCRVSNPEEWAKADFEVRRWNPLDNNPLGGAENAPASPPSSFES